MRIVADKRLFWFLKENSMIDLSDQSDMDMYIQQVVTHGRSQDIKELLRSIGLAEFRKGLARLSRFLPWEVRKFWEDALGGN